MKILLSNKDIYNNTINLQQHFNEHSDLYLPVLVNFAIQKNFATLFKLSEIIEKIRNDVAKRYGEPNGDGSYFIAEDKREAASKELDQLMEAQQSVEISMIKIGDIKDLKMTSQQMASLLFMIEEE